MSVIEQLSCVRKYDAGNAGCRKSQTVSDPSSLPHKICNQTKTMWSRTMSNSHGIGRSHSQCASDRDGKPCMWRSSIFSRPRSIWSTNTTHNSHCCVHQIRSHCQYGCRPKSVTEISIVYSRQTNKQIESLWEYLIVIHKRNACNGTTVHIFECLHWATVAWENVDAVK